MRTKDKLFRLEEVSTLLQYLYMNKNHTVTFNNGFTDLEIRMAENYNFEVLNHNFRELGWTIYNDVMTIPYILNLIAILKQTESRFPQYFKDKWDEIKRITTENLILNKKDF